MAEQGGRLGVDIGGTFTDVALEVGGWRYSAKILTTPEAPERAVLEAMIEHGPAVDGVSRLRTPTVDGLDIATHHRILRMIRTLVERGHAI